MVSMAGPAGGMRAPCFWFGSTGAVLPAFGAFTGGQRVLPVKGDRVYAIGPGQVVELSSGRAGKR
jgi:metallophosphoesterase superfamily enzyme